MKGLSYFQCSLTLAMFFSPRSGKGVKGFNKLLRLKSLESVEYVSILWKHALHSISHILVEAPTKDWESF